MPEKSPAFQFYPKDFLADENVALMGNEETGIYVRLLCYCWLQGSIPADLDALARMLPRTTEKGLTKAWAIIGRCFHASDVDGRLVHRRLDSEREKQATRRGTQSEAGKIGASKRWATNKGGNRGAHKGRHSHPIDSPMGSDSSPSPTPVNTSSLRSDAANGSEKPVLPDWIEPLRAEISAIVGKPLSSLTVDERFALGRYHAWRWGNCKKSEALNRKRGTPLSAGIANLGNDRRFGQLTVRDYIAFADRVWKERGESPWWKPWDITACVEFVAAS